MLTEKDKKNISLTPVKKSGARIIPLKKPEPPETDASEEEEKLLPPLTQFNTGYNKGRDDDPL